MLAQTPPPPYYAVIFTTTRTQGDNGYSAMATKMEELAKQQPGYLGIESAREETVPAWRLRFGHKYVLNLCPKNGRTHTRLRGSIPRQALR